MNELLLIVGSICENKWKRIKFFHLKINPKKLKFWLLNLILTTWFNFYIYLYSQWILFFGKQKFKQLFYIF